MIAILLHRFVTDKVDGGAPLTITYNWVYNNSNQYLKGMKHNGRYKGADSVLGAIHA